MSKATTSYTPATLNATTFSQNLPNDEELLLETGGALLMEDGGELILEKSFSKSTTDFSTTSKSTTSFGTSAKATTSYTNVSKNTTTYTGI